jgi:hypothetical protein
MIIKTFSKIIRTIKFIWEYVILRSIFDLSYRFNFPKLSAHIIVMLTKKLNKEKKYRVLCLGRSQFIDDIQALIDFGSEIQYMYIHKLFFGKIVRYMIDFSFDYSLLKNPTSSTVPEDGLTYHIDPRYKEGKRKVYIYIMKMFDILHRNLKFDAVMSGNYVYVDQQEFFKICDEKNIPGIILNKEGIGASFLTEDQAWGNTEDCKFVGNKILYLNDTYRRHEVRHLQGLNVENTKLIGIPRMDYYFQDNLNSKQQIVFFAYIPSDYLQFDDLSKDEITGVLEISEKFHKHVMEFAKNYPSYNVLIKAKNPDQRYVKYVHDIFLKYFGDLSINNLEITGNGNAGEMILSSNIVLGYNSTVLIEAVAAGKPIICPYFGDILPDNIIFDFFTDYSDLVNYANNYSRMEHFILNYKDYQFKDQERKYKFLDPLIYKADGRSSLRAENAIIETIIESKNKYL